MGFLSSLLNRKKKSVDIIIAIAIPDDIKLFNSVDDAVNYLKKHSDRKVIQKLRKLEKSFLISKKVRALRISEDNEITPFDSLDDLKKIQFRSNKENNE